MAGNEIQVKTHQGTSTIPVGAPLVEAVTKLAKDLGLTHFRLFLAGVEVGDPSQAPAVVEEGMEITLFPYDRAGS